MLKIINYKYLLILVLLVNLVGCNWNKNSIAQNSSTQQISNNQVSQNNNPNEPCNLIQEYEELELSINKFIQDIKNEKSDANSSEQRKQLQKIDKCSNLSEDSKQTIQSISSKVIIPAENKLSSQVIQEISKNLNLNLDVKEEDSIKQITEFLKSELESIKNAIPLPDKINFLIDEMKNLKKEIEYIKNLVTGSSLLGIVLIISGLFLQYYLYFRAKNSSKNKSSISTEPSNPTTQPELPSQPEPVKQTTNEEQPKISTPTDQKNSSKEETNTIGNSNNNNPQEEKPPEPPKPPVIPEPPEPPVTPVIPVIPEPPQSAFDIVRIFNHNPEQLSQYTIEVSETSQSIDNRRLGYKTPVILERVGRNKGIAWVINVDHSDYLLPKSNLIINEFNYETIQASFNCQNYQQGQSKEFELVNPARLASQGETWEIIEKGTLRFN